MTLKPLYYIILLNYLNLLYYSAKKYDRSLLSLNSAHTLRLSLEKI